MFNPWFGFSVKAALLAFEAQQVIALRMVRIMAGGVGAQREATRMFAEKGAAAFSAGIDAALSTARGRTSSSTAKQTVAGYRKRVRANRRRLAR